MYPSRPVRCYLHPLWSNSCVHAVFTLLHTLTATSPSVAFPSAPAISDQRPQYPSSLAFPAFDPDFHTPFRNARRLLLSPSGKPMTPTTASSLFTMIPLNNCCSVRDVGVRAHHRIKVKIGNLNYGEDGRSSPWSADEAIEEAPSNPVAIGAFFSRRDFLRHFEGTFFFYDGMMSF